MKSKEMEQQLEVMRSKYTQELGALQAKAAEIHAEMQEKRSKIAALETLLGGKSDGTAVAAPSVSGADDEGFTPVEAYWRPILEVLAELGGRGHRREVIRLVGEKMKNILTKADYGMLPKAHNTIRWRNRVAWQASSMRARNLINPNSRRGIWEITDAGRKWLDDNP